MPESTENLILEHFAPMRTAVDRVEQRLDDVTIRIDTLKHPSRMSNRFASIVSRQGSRGSKKALNWPMRKVPG
jgi:hypothetical protein